MCRLPRLALAHLTDGPEPSTACLSLLAGLTLNGWRVQHFHSQARPLGETVVGAITGLPGRHLDPWLMPPEVCREVLVRGSRQADLTLVEGAFSVPSRTGCRPDRRGVGRIGPLVEALDLPVLAVLPCRRLDDLHLPPLPPEVQGILLDGLEEPEELDAIRRLIRIATRRPVVGAIEARHALRGLDTRAPLPSDLIEHLGRDFLRHADLTALRTLADSSPWTDPYEPLLPGYRRDFRVALAQDEAFGGYYPDTLETLEALGAELVEFSPLRSESLPRGVDLVIIGCGYPDRYADELAANFSLIGSLKHHVCKGQRIYTEGGGTAYLGRFLILGERRVPGAGILPLDAVLRDRPRAPTPVSRVLARDSWLGNRGTPVRGYRSGRWTMRPAPDPGDCPARSGPLTPQRDLFFRHHAIGSLIHLHLAALPQVVEAFAVPHRPSLCLPARS
jgi:cobyrinic acid a,c-diamide synthase